MRGVLVHLVLLVYVAYGYLLRRPALNQQQAGRSIHLQVDRVLHGNSLLRHSPLLATPTNGRNVDKEKSKFALPSVAEETVDLQPASSNIPLPKHDLLVEGKLDNGFTYIILPNTVPPGRFEAHLEVLSGSAHELEKQQGMAHLLEHVAYMGSPKRQLISGTGSRTNAYTDFHHTVFYAACPTQTPDQFWKKPMLPMALDALLDVMTTNVDVDRLEKERAAVLSEASMVNKMEYRVECQVLSALHTENRISTRFPIGKEYLIKTWTREDVQQYHQMHYRPDNVILFVVGDVDVSYTIDTIKQKFGNLEPKIDHKKLISESGEYPDMSMRDVSRHFPPVLHRWSGTVEEDAVAGVCMPEEILKPELPPETLIKDYLPAPRIFKHELLQSFSFHLFAKRPIEPITTFESLRREIMRRMALSALQIRFNVQQRQDPLFTFVDFNQLNWPREGCAVCSLDLTTDLNSWKGAVRLAVAEIRRLGLFGLSEGELVRYKQAVLAEAEQSAAQADQIAHEEILTELMEAEACGHTFMHPMQRLDATEAALDSITLDDMNAISKELCEHLSHIDASEGVKPAAVIACAPLIDRENLPFELSDEEVNMEILEALKEPLDPIEDIPVPDTLISVEELRAKAAKTKPDWVPLQGKIAKVAADVGASNGGEPITALRSELGTVQRQLQNGVRVNMISQNGEPQRASVRLYVPGGRMLEGKDTPGAVLLGARTMQEGGAFLSMSREEVELFCIDHLVMVDIIADEDALIFDFQSVTSTRPGGKVTGLEAVMQVMHIILTDFEYEGDAFERARQGFHEQYDSTKKGLETACQDLILKSLTQGDLRYLTPTHEHINALTLDCAVSAIKCQLGPEAIEVSISADAPMNYLESLSLNYLGTVPVRDSKREVIADRLSVATMGKEKQLAVLLSDSDERAMGYVAGSCANRWGFFANGTTVSELLDLLSGKKEDRRRHPLFSHAVLTVLQEIANRRLFTVVREEKRLTYDASFNLKGSESTKGGWFLVSVTSSPGQVQDAVQACKDALKSLRGPFGLMGDSVQSAKRTLLSRFRSEIGTNKYWVETLSGTQVESIPYKSVRCIAEYEKVLGSVAVQDVQLLIELLGFENDDYTTCVGIAGPRVREQ
jgi:predicted Zn-dependent peptidase